MEEKKTYRVDRKVTAKGRITLPDWLRERENIEVGDIVSLDVKVVGVMKKGKG